MMKLLLCSLLLASLLAFSSWSVSSGIRLVSESPDVSVMEGNTVNITCCWRWEFKRLRVFWLKNQTDITRGSSLIEHSTESQKETDCSNLTFTAITREDSGRYACRLSVEIPTLTVVEGNGTVITVMARDNTKDSTAENGPPAPNSKNLPFSLIVSLAVVVPLLLFLLSCFCILKRTQVQTTRVIYEAPHVDSEEADMDKHSTSSSRGSSQWCQVAVYESIDYFERVQTKESG